MGLFKIIIRHTVVKKVEDALADRVAEELPNDNKSNVKKPPLFKSPEERAEYASLYFIASQFIYTMILVACQENCMSWGVFYRSYSMSAFISCALLLLGLLVYGLYRVDLLPLLLMILPLPLFFIMPIGFEYGFSIFKDFFLGIWMNTTTKLMCTSLGIAAIVLSITVVCYYENGGKKKKAHKKASTPISDEEAENKRKMLRSAIQENSINIRFLKRKWNFSTSIDVLFGYDDQNKQFVFVSDQNSYTLSSKKVVYLDFEDVTIDPDSAVNTNEYQRLIKLYYLGSSRKESVLPLAQVYASDEEINRIKYYANNTPAGSSEVVFRRKIRHLASTLEREFYPYRPFANDEWFDLLKECMEKIKNNNTDGYSLFRDRVIAAEDYIDDDVLFSIISDLSVDPPDKASAKKEARRLCLRDFGSTLGNNIKSHVKDFFFDSE